MYIYIYVIYKKTEISGTIKPYPPTINATVQVH